MATTGGQYTHNLYGMQRGGILLVGLHFEWLCMWLVASRVLFMHKDFVVQEPDCVVMCGGNKLTHIWMTVGYLVAVAGAHASAATRNKERSG